MTKDDDLPEEAGKGRRSRTASFSGLSATNVLFGLTRVQLGVCAAGLVLFVTGFLTGMNPVPIVLGVVLFAYGAIRWDGLSLISRTYVWLMWRRHVHEGSLKWRWTPLSEGRPQDALGLWGMAGERAMAFESSGNVTVGAPWNGACYVFDPDKREAVAVLRVDAMEWSYLPDADAGGDMPCHERMSDSLASMLADLAERPAIVELKFTIMRTPAPRRDLTVTPPEGRDGDVPDWQATDLREMGEDPDIAHPWRNMTFVSVRVNVDRLDRRSYRDLGERDAVGMALGDLLRDLVAPRLVDAGARPGSVRWCGTDDLRRLNHLIAHMYDPTEDGAFLPVERDEPALTYFEESRDGRDLAMDWCRMRTLWVTKWPDLPVPAGWLRDLTMPDRGIHLMFTLVCRPMTMRQSEADRARKQNSLRQRARLQDQRDLNAGERSESREQERRRLEQESNWPDMDYQGFVTVFAPDRSPDSEELQRCVETVINTGRRWHVGFNDMRGQQALALLACLPYGG